MPKDVANQRSHRAFTKVRPQPIARLSQTRRTHTPGRAQTKESPSASADGPDGGNLLGVLGNQRTRLGRELGTIDAFALDLVNPVGFHGRCRPAPALRLGTVQCDDVVAWLFGQRSTSGSGPTRGTTLRSWRPASGWLPTPASPSTEARSRSRQTIP